MGRLAACVHGNDLISAAHGAVVDDGVLFQNTGQAAAGDDVAAQVVIRVDLVDVDVQVLDGAALGDDAEEATASYSFASLAVPQVRLLTV